MNIFRNAAKLGSGPMRRGPGRPQGSKNKHEVRGCSGTRRVKVGEAEQHWRANALRRSERLNRRPRIIYGLLAGVANRRPRTMEKIDRSGIPPPSGARHVATPPPDPIIQITLPELVGRYDPPNSNGVVKDFQRYCDTEPIPLHLMKREPPGEEAQYKEEEDIHIDLSMKITS